MCVTLDDPDLVALAGVTSHLQLALSAIDAEHRALATPCSDWDLSGLVDHVTGGNWFPIRALAGDSSDEAMASTMRADTSSMLPRPSTSTSSSRSR